MAAGKGRPQRKNTIPTAFEDWTAVRRVAAARASGSCRLCNSSDGISLAPGNVAEIMPLTLSLKVSFSLFYGRCSRAARRDCLGSPAEPLRLCNLTAVR